MMDIIERPSKPRYYIPCECGTEYQIFRTDNSRHRCVSCTRVHETTDGKIDFVGYYCDGCHELKSPLYEVGTKEMTWFSGCKDCLVANRQKLLDRISLYQNPKITHPK